MSVTLSSSSVEVRSFPRMPTYTSSAFFFRPVLLCEPLWGLGIMHLPRTNTRNQLHQDCSPPAVFSVNPHHVQESRYTNATSDHGLIQCCQCTMKFWWRYLTLVRRDDLALEAERETGHCKTLQNGTNQKHHASQHYRRASTPGVQEVLADKREQEMMQPTENVATITPERAVRETISIPHCCSGTRANTKQDNARNYRPHTRVADSCSHSRAVLSCFHLSFKRTCAQKENNTLENVSARLHNIKDVQTYAVVRTHPAVL